MSIARIQTHSDALIEMLDSHCKPLINTVALARCKNALSTGQLFQQFRALLSKPLKRLTDLRAPVHRAKATVLMRGFVGRRALATQRPSWATEHRGAFSLTELLVILAMLAFGCALMAPALARTKTNGHGIGCLNNLRQVMGAWKMYAEDHSDQVANNFGFYGTLSTVSSEIYPNWVSDVISWYGVDGMNTNFALLKLVGQLAPYLNGKVSVFKCPADTYLSAAQRRTGWTARPRSVSMSSVFGRSSPTDPNDSTARGLNPLLPQFAQYLKLPRVPKPSKTWVVLDEHPDSINDGYFVVPPNALSWGDIPASYHNGGCGFAFADGHSEIKKWLSTTSKFPVRYFYYQPPSFDPAGRLDLQWCLERTGYTDANTGRPAYGY